MITSDTFIISDTHFGDYRIENFEPSRLKLMQKYNVDNIDEAMILSWNEAVKKDDVVFHLGDFAYKKIEYYSNALNGEKILIRGNHDKQSYNSYLQRNWLDVIEKPVFELGGIIYKGVNIDNNLISCFIKDIDGKKVMFSHFPVVVEELKNDNRYFEIRKKLLDIYNKFNCDINIHGHMHSNSIKDNGIKFINISTEVINFKPIRLKKLLYNLEQNSHE